MQINDAVSKALYESDPDMDAPSIASSTAALVALEAVRLVNGQLLPGAVEAVAQAKHIAPRLFERMAHDAALRQTTPQMQTIAYYAALGTTLDAAITGGAAPVTDLTAANELMNKQRRAGTYSDSRLMGAEAFIDERKYRK